jgi:hypothetical protein
VPRGNPAPPPPSVFDATLKQLRKEISSSLGETYAETWRDSLTSGSGSGVHVKTGTTDPTGETYLNNRGTREALYEAHRKLEDAVVLVRSARAMVASTRERTDKDEGVTLTDQEKHEMERRARARPSRTWESPGRQSQVAT